ncbi:glycogen/starch synthase [Crocosphaera watsonii]|uniref:Glycogen synthase n=1 Tax=Crocosphaera watsonii WH 8502 TaxID=423474 RepID=T2IHE5_CROWT|nr:glycogen/starch synthase [Crocosphaera watsonii]CCQ52272.1 Glycogen synthase, ADP-glucose transglucosylase [Crocosphaera watsonii WH 8502]
MLNICFVSTEVAPYSKTGGLGDVTEGLPEELAKMGHTVCTVAPRFDQYKDAWDTGILEQVKYGKEATKVRYFHSYKKGVDRIWVDHHVYLSKTPLVNKKLYGPKAAVDYVDNSERFSMLAQAALAVPLVVPLGPDGIKGKMGENTIFVCNDWHTALLPLYLKEYYQSSGTFLKAKTVLLLHNIAFQGRFPMSKFEALNLPEKYLPDLSFNTQFAPPPLDEKTTKPITAPEPMQMLNWLKAGFLNCDQALTVSPNFAKEVTSDPAGGVELDAIAKSVGLVGITNGTKAESWNPKKDKFIPANYDAETMDSGKKLCKAALQEECGLEVDPDIPILGFIGRLENQKGPDVIMAAMPELAKLNCQVVILGTGAPKLEEKLEALENTYPFAKGVAKFDPELARLITAGADYCLMPSRFEPCGLNQLYAMMYGTIPVVAPVGGLVDTVLPQFGFLMGKIPLPDKPGVAVSEAMLEEGVEAMIVGIKKALQEYGTPKFEQMRLACMANDVSWQHPAAKYVDVFEALMSSDIEA